MRIIYYSPHPTHDIVSEVGYATHQREVIEALRNAGHEVIPVIMGGTEISNLNLKTLETYKPSVIKMGLKRIVPRFIWTTLNNYKLVLHDQKASKRLESEIQNSKPDLIYERSEYLQDSGAKMSKKHKIKYFLEVNAPFVEEMKTFEGFSLLERKAHQIERYKLMHADKVFAVSSALKEFLIQRYQCDANKIIMQPNCINPDRIVLNMDVSNQIKSKYKIETKKIIGFVGSIFPYHGVDVLIKGFAKSASKHQNSVLMVVGDGTIVNDLKLLCTQLNIDKKVIFTGKVPHSEVFTYIQMMDICVMAKSNWYGSPVKIFEYGLMQKPIIAPNTSPIKDVMINEEEGLIIDENETNLEIAINTLLEDEVLSQKLATNFHSKIMKSYTWDSVAKKIIEACA